MSSIKQHPALYKIVVVHYLVSAVCFLALAIMLLFASDVLTGHYFHPRILAITHMAALGWGTLMIFGASYQLLPVVLETDLYNHRLAWFSFGFFLCGLISLVCAFWIFDPGLHMQVGSIFLLVGIVLYGVNIFLTGRKNKNAQSIEQELIITSCVWLTCTAILGALMVFNFRYAFLPEDHLQFLKLHAHMGIGGWFLLLIMGVSSKLLPMFLVSSKPRVKLLTWSYYLINAALILFLVDTYIFGINVRTYFIAAIAVSGIVSFLLFVRSCFTTRIRKAIDLPIMNTVLSFALLAAGIIVIPFIIYYHLKNDPAAVRLTTLYGTLLFMGWISALILGQTFKTLPFIVWVKHYEHLAGKVKTPLPADMYKSMLLKVQSAAFLLFCLSFFAGVLFKAQVFIIIGLVSLLCTALIYVLNVLKVLLHKTKIINYDKL